MLAVADETDGTHGPTARAQRSPEIDLLRVVALVSVFAAHAAQPFNPWDVWHVQAPQPSKWLGELVLFFAPWVMPLFVLLAGASAWYSLGKRSVPAYLDERVTRLIIPLAAGILLVVPPQVYFDRRQHGRFDGSFAEFYPHFFDGVYPRGNFTWAHLWFLGILALLALITLPLFRWLRGDAGRRAMTWVASVCDRPGAILLLAIPMIGVRATLWLIFPHARPITIDWSNRTTLFATFVSGYMLAGEPRLMAVVDRQWKLALAVALTFATGMFAWAWPGDFTQRFPVPFSPRFVVVWSTYALGGWAWCVALLGAARTVPWGSAAPITRSRGLLNPFYILHQTVIVMLAFYLTPLDRSPIEGYALLFPLAFGVTLVIAMAAQRSAWSRRLLGVRGTREHHRHRYQPSVR